MSRKKAIAAKIKLQFDNDTETLDAVEWIFKELEFLKRASDLDYCHREKYRSRLKEIITGYVAWTFQESGNRAAGIKSAEMHNEDNAARNAHIEKEYVRLSTENPKLSKYGASRHIKQSLKEQLGIDNSVRTIVRHIDNYLNGQGMRCPNS